MHDTKKSNAETPLETMLETVQKSGGYGLWQHNGKHIETRRFS